MPAHAAPEVVFLDACVLYPPLVRALLLGAAGAGLLRPRWSERVLEEWRLAVAKRHGVEAEGMVEATRATMAARFPEARCEEGEVLLEALHLPDPADLHVVAAAAGCGAKILVTFNVRDFPRRALAPLGIEVRHPDGFLWELLSKSPAEMADVIRTALAEVGTGDRTDRAVLKRARLPRLAKAWAAMSPTGAPD